MAYRNRVNVYDLTKVKTFKMVSMSHRLFGGYLKNEDWVISNIFGKPFISKDVFFFIIFLIASDHMLSCTNILHSWRYSPFPFFVVFFYQDVPLSLSLAKRMYWTIAYLSAAMTMFDAQSALKSGSHFSRKNSSSLTMLRMLLLLTSAKHSSIARLEGGKYKSFERQNNTRNIYKQIRGRQKTKERERVRVRREDTVAVSYTKHSSIARLQ